MTSDNEKPVRTFYVTNRANKTRNFVVNDEKRARAAKWAVPVTDDLQIALAEAVAWGHVRRMQNPIAWGEVKD